MQTKGSLLISLQLRLLIAYIGYLTHINGNTYHSDFIVRWLHKNFSFVIQNVLCVKLAQWISCAQGMFVYVNDVTTSTNHLSQPSWYWNNACCEKHKYLTLRPRTKLIYLKNTCFFSNSYPTCLHMVTTDRRLSPAHEPANPERREKRHIWILLSLVDITLKFH